MATRKTTAAKSAPPKSAARKTTRQADPTAEMRDAIAKPFKGLAERLQNLKLSGTAGAVLDSGRKDLAALVKANEKSYQGLQTVVARQTEMLRAAITDWQGAMSAMPGKDPKENMAKLDEMGRAAFQRALDDMRELAELAAKSQADAFDIMRQRITDNVDQVSQLLTKGGKKQE
jgi:phasin family protein